MEKASRAPAFPVPERDAGTGLTKREWGAITIGAALASGHDAEAKIVGADIANDAVALTDAILAKLAAT